MTVKVFTNTDDNAPVLTGQDGSLINLLDKCLVYGFGTSQSLGWSKPFSGTNLAVYRQPSGAQRYLRIDNVNTQNNSTYNAKARAYESMSDVSTGSGPFPTVEQSSSGLVWRISGTNNSTARNWLMIGDEKFFYLIIEDGATAGYRSLKFFGDFSSYQSGDLYNQIIGGAHDVTIQYSPLYQSIDIPGSQDQLKAGLYVARNYTQIGSSTTAIIPFDGYQFTRATPGSAPVGVWPQMLNPATGDLLFGRFYLSDRVSLRGEMPGMWAPLFKCTDVFNHGDVITGIGNLAGRTLKLLRLQDGYGVQWAAIETSNTWYT